MVDTPLWHKENPEKLKSLGTINAEAWIAPVDIAKEMLKLCEDWTLEGGSVVEVIAKDKPRVVELFNDPGPTLWKKGSNMTLEQDVFDVMQKEKGQ